MRGRADKSEESEENELVPEEEVTSIPGPVGAAPVTGTAVLLGGCRLGSHGVLAAAGRSIRVWLDSLL